MGHSVSFSVSVILLPLLIAAAARTTAQNGYDEAVVIYSASAACTTSETFSPLLERTPRSRKVALPKLTNLEKIAPVNGAPREKLALRPLRIENI